VQRQSTTAYVLHYYPELRQTFVRDEIDGVAELGHDIQVIAMREGTSAPDEPLRDAVTLPGVFSLSLWGRALRATLKRPALSLRLLREATGLRTRAGQSGGRARNLLHGVRGLALADMLETDPRLAAIGHLHCHFDERTLVCTVVAARRSGLGHSYTVHTISDVAGAAWKARGAAFVACVSRSVREWLMELLPDEPRPPLELVRCGVDVARWQAPRAVSTPSRIVSVGALIELKGHAVLLEAAAQLAAEGQEFELVIVGEGEERAALAAQIEQRGLEARASLAGALPRQEVLMLLSTASVLALACRRDAAGRHDGIPVALMEAMAAGVPVVSTRISGIPELLQDGTNGLLVEPDDPDSLAAALGRVLQEAGLAARLASAARVTVEGEFSLARQCERMHALLSAAARGHGSAGETQPEER